MNGEFQKYRNADAVIPDTITAIWSAHGNYDVQANPGGTTVGNQIIATGFSVSGTSIFHRVMFPFADLTAAEWRVLTSTRSAVMTGGEASNPPHFRDCAAFYEIECNDSKGYSGNIRTIDAYDPGADPPEEPPTPVDTPEIGTVTLGIALFRDSLKEAHWFFFFSPGFNLYDNSDDDPLADLSLNFDNGTQMKVGGGTNFGKTWMYATPSGTGFPGYTVHSWTKNLSMAVST